MPHNQAMETTARVPHWWCCAEAMWGSDFVSNWLLRFFWWLRVDLNHRPQHYEWVALDRLSCKNNALQRPPHIHRSLIISYLRNTPRSTCTKSAPRSPQPEGPHDLFSRQDQDPAAQVLGNPHSRLYQTLDLRTHCKPCPTFIVVRIPPGWSRPTRPAGAGPRPRSRR